jgi:hypothetical protein
MVQTANKPSNTISTLPTLWIDPHGNPVCCAEKIKVLNENLTEITLLCQEALEDAVLMGCDEQFVRRVLVDMVSTLATSFAQ